MTDDSLILTIAEKLIDKEVDSKAITKVLEIISNHFSFNFCFIYEKDQFNQFNLMERKVSDEKDLRYSFLLEELPEEYQNKLMIEPMVYCDKNNNLIEKEICDFFHMDSLVLYLMADDAKQSLGLLVFASDNKKIEMKQESSKTLQIVTSLLSKYISRRMYENRVSFSIISLESILDNTGIDIYVNDFHNHDILYVNKSMAAPYGGREEFMGHKCWEVLFPGQNGPCEFCPQKKLVDENGLINKVYTWDYQRAFDGSWFRVFSAAFRWIDGRLAHVVSSADITDNKKYEAMINHMANYDALTDLPNRRMLVDECKNRINKATETERGYILFFDIDGFKAINDNYGHESGDEFLIQLAKFFSEIPMLKDAIYRNGGDEFVAIIGGEEISKVNIHNLARFIQQRFTKPWKLKKGEVYCSTSIGVACYPEDGRDAEILIHKADQAMYQVKKQGGGDVCFGYELKPPKK